MQLYNSSLFLKITGLQFFATVPLNPCQHNVAVDDNNDDYTDEVDDEDDGDWITNTLNY